MEPYLITERCEYDYAVSRGFEPLIDTKHFRLDIRLRIELQREKFGHCVFGRGADIMVANARFFKWVWEHKPHYCECCMRPLPEYSATYCSHILTRGAHPEMAHDPRNINILCFKHHNQWEQETTRKGMRIYPANLLRIEELKQDYKNENKGTETI